MELPATMHAARSTPSAVTPGKGVFPLLCCVHGGRACELCQVRAVSAACTPQGTIATARGHSNPHLPGVRQKLTLR
eukprot:352589-Chlamydomonas_euryale.AAC.1